MSSRKLYIPLLKDENGLLSHIGEISSSLASAKKAVAGNDPRAAVQTAAIPDNEPEFLKLMRQTASELEKFKALQDSLAFWVRASPVFHFMSTLEPSLQKVGTLEVDDSHRKIYSFDPTSGGSVVRAIRKLTNGVLGTMLIPKLALIGLVGAYDVILQGIIRTGISSQEKLASAIDRNISLRDLKTFSSIKEAVDHLVEREIETILQQDHLEQLKSLNKLFGIAIDVEDDCVCKFLEICERRNLFTHNAGIVNQRYITKCKNVGADVSNVKVGDELDCGSEYYSRAVSTVDELCIKLIQFIWRKLCPIEAEAASRELNDHAYRLIQNEEYVLAERVLYYGLNHVKKPSDHVHRMMVVNYANAINLEGDKGRSLRELDALDWSASGLAFQISVASVRGDLPKVLELMKTIGKNGELSASSYREWPVFRKMRSDVNFQDQFRKIFREELIVVPKVEIGDAAVVASSSNSPMTKGSKRSKSKLH